jgi:hypothetical protein
MAVKSKAEATKIAETLLAKIEILRQEAQKQGDRFEALTKEQLVSKIMGKTSKSPFFIGERWGAGNPGGSTNFWATVHNPDARAYSSIQLFGYLFFGPANFIASPDVALTSVDERFSHYYQGCEVAAGSNATMAFTIDVPAGLRPGIYMGNCFLLHSNPMGVGTYLDRTEIDLTVR